LGVHRIYTDLMQPWTLGYSRHPVMRAWWKFIDIDQVKYAKVAGK